MNEGVNQITEQIIGAAIEVHRELGPGLLESAYQRGLAHDELFEVHEAQVLTYLRFTHCRIGLLMNFRSTTLMRGLKRLAL